MSLSANREALARIHGRYQRAGRLHKKIILDEFCATCGYHRKAAVRLLNRPLRTGPSKRSGPKVVYDRAQVLPVLKAVWLASDQLCSKLLKAALPQWLEHHEGRTTPLPKAFKEKLLKISPALPPSASQERALCDTSRHALAPRRADALRPAGHFPARVGRGRYGGPL